MHRFPAASLLLALAACESRPAIIVRRMTPPAERTLAEMRPQYHEPIGTCELPAVTPSPGDVEIVMADGGLRIPVGTGWDPAPRTDTTMRSGDTTVTLRWRDPASGSIALHRMRYGNAGPVWTERASPPVTALPTCEASVGEAGAIWRRYDPADSSGSRRRFPFFANGEVITADSVRYRVDVAAVTARERDELLRRISDAAVGQSSATATATEAR